jgi:hypothetical protein
MKMFGRVSFQGSNPSIHQPVQGPFAEAVDLNEFMSLPQVSSWVSQLPLGTMLRIASNVRKASVLAAISSLPPGRMVRFDRWVNEQTLMESAVALRAGRILVISPHAPMALFALAAQHLKTAVLLHLDMETPMEAACAAASSLTNGAVIELHQCMPESIAAAVAARLPDGCGLALKALMPDQVMLSTVRSLGHLNSLHVNDQFSASMLCAIAAIMPPQVAFQLWGSRPSFELQQVIYQARSCRMVAPCWAFASGRTVLYDAAPAMTLAKTTHVFFQGSPAAQEAEAPVVQHQNSF